MTSSSGQHGLQIGLDLGGSKIEGILLGPGAKEWARVTSTSTVPDVTSKRRGTRLTRVDFPAPVLPTMAVVCPGAVANETPLRTGCSAPG